MAALLVADASTDSLRWAVDLASATGAGDDAVAAVLIATGSAAGSAQLVATAGRLARALGYDPEQPTGFSPLPGDADRDCSRDLDPTPRSRR